MSTLSIVVLSALVAALVAVTIAYIRAYQRSVRLTRQLTDALNESRRQSAAFESRAIGAMQVLDRMACGGQALAAPPDNVRGVIGRIVQNLNLQAVARVIQRADGLYDPIGDVALSVRGLCLEGKFHGVSFDLRQGEILGFAGLVGSGRSNVAETLFGVTPATSGSILINGKEIAIRNPGTAMDAGMGFLTEDRKASGCFLLLDIMANMQIALLRHGHATAGFVKEHEIEALCQQQKNRLRVRTPDLEEPIINLSGGNQQKVLIARWLMTKPKILILDEPTRGIDVGAKAEIHKLITELAGQGVAVLMISSELPEVLGMSDRVLVMHEGRMTGIVDRKDATQVRIMELASQ